MAWHGRKPKTTKGAAALVPALNVRLTQAQHHAYLAAGGAEWLRAQLEAEIVRQQLAPTPTANNPFPPTTRDTDPDTDLSAFESYHGI